MRIPSNFATIPIFACEPCISMTTNAAPHPTELRRLDTRGIRVTWSNGVVSEIASEVVRAACPCAGCKQQRGEGASHDRPLTHGSPEESGAVRKKKSLLKIVDSQLGEQCSLQEIQPIGNYAVCFRWGDGHASGIYTYQYLYTLCS